MARMYSRRKGKAGSSKPAKPSVASWLRYKEKEIELLITKLAKEGKSPSYVGIILRDTYGIPDSKLVTKKAITQILKEKNISLDKVNKFKEDVIKGFNEAVILRDIFKHYKLYENRIKEKYNGKLERFGLNNVDDKAVFFDEWYTQYLDWGIEYGRNIASSEDLDIIEKIANNCKETKEKDIDKILNKFNNLSNIIIFVINLDLFDFFKDLRNFIFKWSKNSPQFDIKGFAGWYIFKEKYIPVFEIFQDRINKQMLVLNKVKWGKLIQISPLNKGESKDLMKDIFYMNIRSFSEIPELMDNFIKDPPDWLKKIEDEKKQREHLQEKVSIQIYESFRYNKDREFQGYLLNIEKVDK